MREGPAVAAASRRVIAGVSGSLRSLGALRAAAAEARKEGAALVAVLASAPAGGELAYTRAPCPLLLRLWEQAARERMREAFGEPFGGLPGDVTVHQMVVRGSPGPVLVGMPRIPMTFSWWVSEGVRGVTRFTVLLPATACAGPGARC